ncbi:hypothetical protein SPV1_08336 [Mariprofundus ferrooxydans PV-1]|uniref:Uncharacterized protein n=1 Tax=Mariprofundus ferrooxydans PV-1 TaxID=314345 RepID=Q0EYZ6_9PROT|nr:hypothetical protein SPV1_08336 [Mariprofundus ferrooxydans PV-1]
MTASLIRAELFGIAVAFNGRSSSALFAHGFKILFKHYFITENMKEAGENMS